MTQERVLIGNLDVSRETELLLAKFEGLVEKWNVSINLIAKSTVGSLRTRHTLDSAQLYAVAPKEARKWVDLGSGAGFPGLVIAILARELNPMLKVLLIESDQRKAAFLREAVRILGLDAEVSANRVESLKTLSADIVSARALAPLDRLLEYAERHLVSEGLAIFPKGERAGDEIATARAVWNFRVDSLPSLTDSGARILIFRNIRRADDR